MDRDLNKSEEERLWFDGTIVLAEIYCNSQNFEL